MCYILGEKSTSISALQYQFNFLNEKLMQTKRLQFADLETKVVLLVAKMEHYGIVEHFDTLLLSQLYRDLKLLSQKLELACYKCAKRRFNISSHNEVAKILFCELKLPCPDSVLTEGKKSHYSTNKRVLKKLSLIHPLPGLIEQYRKVQHSLNVYVLPLKRMIDENSDFRLFFRYECILCLTSS